MEEFTPEKFQKMQQELNNRLLEKNTITVSEFHKFVPLFQKDGYSRLGDEKYKSLCEAYQDRVSIFEPVVIIKNNSAPADREIVEVLPPMFDSPNPLNGITNSNQITDAFNNTMRNSADNPISIQPEIKTKMMLDAVELTNRQNEKTLQQSIDKYKNFVKEITAKPVNSAEFNSVLNHNENEPELDFE